MEIEELQKIWNDQKGETMYAINESALHRSITRKKNVASRKINKVEIGVIIINSFCSIFLFVDALDDPHYWDFIGSGLMAVTVAYILLFRRNRKKSENNFDRSMMGELEHAISNTNSIIKFNFMMLAGYLFPMSIFYIVKMIDRAASFEKWLFVIGMYLLAFLLIRWERKRMLLPNKKRLEKLKEKLKED